MSDFKRVAAAALHESERLVSRWLPDGHRAGREWVAANPMRPGSDGGGAFSVNLHTGAWSDFAGSDKGGDLLSLCAYLFHNGEQLAAMLDLAKELGIALEKSAPTAPAARRSTVPAGAAPARPSPASDGELECPVPADAPAIETVLNHYKMGAAAAHWVYRNALGQVVMLVIRWNVVDREGRRTKEFRPFTTWRMPNGTVEWKPRGLEMPRPLYGLDRLSARPAAPVVVCEGEKAADAAEVLLPAYVAVTSPNGAKSAYKADWTPLAGRRVVIWADADTAIENTPKDRRWDASDGWLQPGMEYARKVAELCKAARAKSIAFVDPKWIAAVRDRVMGSGETGSSGGLF